MDVLDELARVGAILTGKHFVYTSGRHGPNYINLDPLFPNARLTFEICRLLAEPFAGQFDTVASPAVGGVVLCELTALAASTDERPVYAVWADKVDGDMAFERAGFSNHLSRRRVLLVEDLLTTGGSLVRTLQRAREFGAEVVGASVICNRGGLTADALGVPRLESLSEVSFESFGADRCPLCANGVPIVEDIGHGAEYRAQEPGYGGGFVKLLAHAG